MMTLEILRRIDPKLAIRAFKVLPVLVLMTAVLSRADDVVTHWHQVMLDTISADGTDPVTSTRVAAMVQAAVFDSVNGIQKKYTPIHTSIPASKGTSVSAAVIESAYSTLLALYPDQHRDLGQERKSSLARLHDSRDAIKLGQQYGDQVAADILTWRSTDGFDQEEPPYLGGDALGEWRPTAPDYRPGALPQLATMVPWSIKSPSQFRPAGPPSLTSDRYAEVFNETKTMGAAGDSPRTPDQTLLAIFWAGNTPGFWNRIAASVIAEHPKLNLIGKARVLALLNITMSDAAIATWDAKYYYVFWRPITAITLADLDGNPNTEVDPSWTPLLGGTPAHPEYISGHSTISASAATVLAHIFGDNTSFSIDSEKVPGVWRHFSSFSSAVLEIHDARVFGGIHFRTACLDGAVVGTAVAHFVLRHSVRPL